MKFCIFVASILTFVTACSSSSPKSQVASHSDLTDAEFSKLASSLSPYFKEHCVVCHGVTGDQGFAPLLSDMNYDQYIHSVREGHPELHIPAFDANQYPTAAVKRDFQLITGKSAD